MGDLVLERSKNPTPLSDSLSLLQWDREHEEEDEEGRPSTNGVQVCTG